jgi:hypothetical protein
MKLVPYTNIVESVQKEVGQAKLDYKAGRISLETLQYVARKLDNVRDSAAEQELSGKIPGGVEWFNGR